MKPTLNTIATILVTFAFTALLNFAGEKLSQPRGEVNIGPTTDIANQTYVSIDISNFTEDAIDGLLMSIPASSPITPTFISNPIQLSQIPNIVTNTNTSTRISLSGLEPRKTTRIVYLVQDKSEINTFQMINSKELKLSNFQLPSQSSLPPNLPNNVIYPAILYSLIAGALSLVSESHSTELKSKMSDLNTQIRQEKEDYEKRQQDLTERINEVQNRSAQVKLLLLSRLSDYNTELDFWRDTVRKMLYSYAKDEKTPDLLIEKVTEGLKTYSTRQSNLTDFNTIQYLAKLLAVDESKKNSKES